MQAHFFRTVKNKLYPIIFAIILIAILLCFIFGNFSYAVTDGLSLFVAYIMPSLFPFVFITSIISTLKIRLPFRRFFNKICNLLFKTDARILRPFIISVLCGYPIGAKIVGDMKSSGNLTDRQAKLCSILCSTPSPSFCLSAVGKIMFNDFGFGCAVYVISILSSVLSAIIYGFFSKDKGAINKTPRPYQNSKTFSFYDITLSSVLSVITVGGIITIFYLFIEMLSAFNLFYPINFILNFATKNSEYSSAITKGLLECTSGLKTMANLGVKNLPVGTAICCFGGLSIIIQSIAFLKKAKIKTAPFILFKITGAVIGLILGLIFTKLFIF